MLNIEKTNNGFIVSEAIEGVVERNVFMDNTIDLEYAKEKFGTGEEEKIALGQLLEHIAERYGEMYQKYNADNLSIRFDRKGHKLD